MQKVLDQAEIRRKAASGDVEERIEAVKLLRDNFADLPDKKQAWEDLHRLTGDEDRCMRWRAAHALGSAFQYVPDQDEAWEDLHRLVGDEDSDVRYGVAHALRTAFQHVPDKEEAWGDLIRLMQDKDLSVRWATAAILGSVFSQIPGKEKGWVDLIRLTRNKGWEVRDSAEYAIDRIFPHMIGREEGWKDLIRLTHSEYRAVRWNATRRLGFAFPHIPDKTQAWDDLIRLTGDEDSDVRLFAAGALISAFPHIPDKMQAWGDLIRLTEEKEKDVEVRAYVNHSLGRALIVKATEAEDEEDFKSELKNAIEFFERSSNEATYINPSSFCLPFYRSFYSLTFEKAGAEGEVQKYLTEAKSASKGSENKETLLEAVENLANALSEAQKVTDFDATKSNLKACMQYCNRAADLIGDASEGAPSAARILRRGLPIIDERIKKIIREIQEKAEAVCRGTRDTSLEELGRATAISAQELPTHDPLVLMIALGEVAGFARDWCEHLPTDKKADACEQLKNLTDMELSEQGAAIARVFEYVQENIHIPKIQTVHISETKHEIVRIAVAQFCFELTESFPFTLKNKDEVKTKVFSALKIAKQNGANIVCLPELCLCEDWISEIEEQCPDIVVIGGSFYKDNQNTCPLIMESDAVIPCQPKITPAVTEYDMMPGARIYRYETRFGKFVILICMDFDDLAHYFREADIDMIFCPAFNSANERFWNEAHSHVERTPSYILIANAGLHGGTSIFGQLDKNYFGKLADRGCKEREDPTYKLCEVKKGCEEVILADFNLGHKSIQKPTPSNRSKVIKSVDHIKKIPIQPDRSRSEVGNE